MLLKKIFVLFAVTAIFLNLTAMEVYAASDVIGYIDTQQILVSHPKYAESQKHLEEFINGKTVKARADAEKETDPQKQRAIVETARQESAREEMSYMNPITEQINGVIETVAKAKGITIVLEKVYVFFGGIDITEDVIKGVRAIK